MNLALKLAERLDTAIKTLKSQVEQNPKFTFNDRLFINNAIEAGKRWHQGQFRDTGDFYFIHPVRVANRTLGFGNDKVMIAAALLHDVLEDTDAEYNELVENLNEEVAEIVKALTKFKKEAQNLTASRIFLLAKKDFRVLLIKMLDRLDNLSDIHELSRHRQRRNAEESILFAAVAEGLGLEELADTFRDLAFRILYPRRFHKVQAEIAEIKHMNRALFEQIKNTLWQSVGMEFAKNIAIEFKAPFDFASPKSVVLNILRSYTLTVNNKLDCYYAIGLIHSHFPVIPFRFRDYLANPLANGWQGLETSVIVHGLTVQILVTTTELDFQNHRGVFTLLDKKMYQGGVYAEIIEKFANLFSEKSVNLSEIFRNPGGNLQLSTQWNLADSSFQVSTPKGKIFQMEVGSTALDFAYAIHSHIGHACIGAIINEAYRVEPSYQLQEGNVVEIITDKSLTPDRSWLSNVKTPHARKEILTYLRKLEKFDKPH